MKVLKAEKGNIPYLCARALSTHDEVGDTLLIMDLDAPAGGTVVVAPRLPLLTITVLLGDELNIDALAVLVLALELIQIVLDLILHLNAGVSELALGPEPAFTIILDGVGLNLEHVLAKQELLIHRLKRSGAGGAVGGADR